MKTLINEVESLDIFGTGSSDKIGSRILSFDDYKIKNNKLKRTFNSAFATIEKYTTVHPKKELIRFLKGFKGEINETGTAGNIFGKYIKGKKLTTEEKIFFGKQMKDVLKSVAIGVPYYLLPLPFVGTISLVLLDRLFAKHGKQFLPSSFYNQEKEIDSVIARANKILKEPDINIKEGDTVDNDELEKIRLYKGSIKDFLKFFKSKIEEDKKKRDEVSKD